MTLFEFKLPDIGEGVVEGEIVQWLIEEGDALEQDQPMVEVMTDKATVEIPSPVSGKVIKRHVAEGAMAQVDQVIVSIETASRATGRQAREAPCPSESATPEASLQKPGPPPPDPARNKIRTTPAVRRMARELGIDLARIHGSGPEGRIRKEDLQNMAQATSPPSGADDGGRSGPSGEDRVERIALRGLRKRISEQMTKSRFTAPHFTLVEEGNMTRLVDVRNAYRDKASARGITLNYLPFVMKAVVHALKKHPILNASLDEARQEIILKRYYHLGIATATEEGLIVPVLRNVDQKDILRLAKEQEDLASRTRQGHARPEELRNSTFTITSLGIRSGIAATPILNYPEVGILAVHRIGERPVAEDGRVVIRQMANFSISCDHRVVDGVVAAEFLADVIRQLENPEGFSSALEALL